MTITPQPALAGTAGPSPGVARNVPRGGPVCRSGGSPPVPFIGLSVLTELAALCPLLLVSDRWRPLRPGVLAPLAWTASGLVVLVALWQLVVLFTVESQTYLSGGMAQDVRAFAFAPLFAIPALMTAVTWSYAKRHQTPGTGITPTTP